jgi:IclR family transcriptional regulator, acetate operon repressor
MEVAVPTDTGLPRVSYLVRFLGLVQVVSAAPDPGLTLSELAARGGLPPSTVSRLARLLEEHGLARRLADKRYVPGPTLLAIGLRSLRRLPSDRFHDAVQNLADLTGESVSVGILLGDEITLVTRRESAHALRYVATVGDVIAPHESAMGKVILAHSGPARRARIVRRAAGDRADVVLAGLEDELAETRETGIGRDEESFAVGLRCVAAPIVGSDGDAVGAVSISGPSARFTRELADRFLPALRDQGRRLSRLPIGIGR